MERISRCVPPQADFIVPQLESLANIGWLTSTPATGMISVSPTVAELVGRSSQGQQLPITDFIDAIHPADRPQVAAILTDPLVEIPTKSGSKQQEKKPGSTDQAQTHREQTGEKTSAAKTNNATDESTRRHFEIEFHVYSPTESTETPPQPPTKKTNTDRTQAGTEQSSQANIESETQNGPPIETIRSSGTRVRMRGEITIQPNSNRNTTADADSRKHLEITDTAAHGDEKKDNEQKIADEEVSIQAIIEIGDRLQSPIGMSTDPDKPHTEETTAGDSLSLNTTSSENNSTKKESSPATAGNKDETTAATTRTDEQIRRAHYIDKLFANGPVSIVQWDANPEWSVQYASENIESVLGHSKKDLERGDPPYGQVIHQEDLQRVTRRVKKETESGTKYFQHKPYRILTPSGNVHWVLDTTHIIRDDDGTVESYLGYLININQKKQNEIQLRQAEKVGSIGSWRLDTQNNEVHWSEEMCDIFEINPDNAPKTLNQSLAHFQPEDGNQLQEVYQQPIEEELDNREYQIQVNGQPKWIEISSKNIRNDSGTIVSVVGNVKEVTEKVKERQNAEIINQTLQDLSNIASSSTGCEEVINTVAGCVDEIFEPDSISAHIFTDDGPFKFVECTDNATDTVVEIEPENGVFWDIFSSNEIQIIDQEVVPSTQLPDEKRSDRILTVPVGNRGLILAFLSNNLEIKEETIESFKPIILTAIETLDRLNKMNMLQQQKADLEEGLNKLEREKSLNQLIRSLIEQIIDAETTEKFLGLSCETLSKYNGFDGVWISKTEPNTNQIVPIAQSPHVKNYLNEVSQSLDSRITEPTIQAVDSQSVVGPINITECLSDGQWAAIAVKYGYQSVISTPIEYNKLTYGALTIVSRNTNTFTENIASLIHEIAILLGFGLYNIERQSALSSDGYQNVEYELEIESSDPVAKLSNHLSHEVRIYNLSKNTSNSTIFHCEIPGANSDDLKTVTDNIEEVYNINNIINELYEVNIISPSIATKVMKINSVFQEMVTSNNKTKLIISSNSNINQAKITQHLNELFNDASMKAKTEVPISDDISWPIILANVLSDQQETILRTAYYTGYFDEKRKRTGGEIAESIGIAQPTFSNRLRAAQRNLFAAIWEKNGI